MLCFVIGLPLAEMLQQEFTTKHTTWTSADVVFNACTRITVLSVYYGRRGVFAKTGGMVSLQMRAKCLGARC